MALSVEFLFSSPQREMASLLRSRLQQCKRAQIVVGFATIEGLEAILPALLISPGKLECFVVGAGTYRVYEVFDRLIGAGVPRSKLLVHLGHSRPTGANARHSFYRYHPMLHSKIYLLDFSDGTTSAFVGSHNLTGFALHGLNGEATVRVDGPTNSSEFDDLRQHIEESKTQAVQYQESMKEALSWWTTQFVEGLRDKVNDVPREGESKKTIVVIAVNSSSPLPQSGDVIYFEIPAALGALQSLNAEVHIYVFSKKPSSPASALKELRDARRSFWCRTEGIENEQGGLELRADWYIDPMGPLLRRASQPFRPAASPGMQQVRVKVRNEVFEEFEYLFQIEKLSWEPLFDTESMVQMSTEEAEKISSLKLIPPEDREWMLVRGLHSVDRESSAAYQAALRDSSPESGSYILLSLRRRKLSD